MPVGRPILAVEGVTKRFGPNEVLKNVTLSIGAQEIRAICGENGAGKSTLVKVFTGVHQVDGGIVLVDGKPTATEYLHEKSSISFTFRLVVCFRSWRRARAVWSSIDSEGKVATAHRDYLGG
jgi:ABC-type branched-subunit amino acid transport system ATPase component